jgi:hypothetical protein
MQPEQPIPQPETQFSPEPPVVATESSQPPQPQPEAPSQDVTQPIQWQGPEYIEHARSRMWFVGFWLVVVLLMAAAFFVVRSWSFAILVPAMAAALMIYSHRPPRMLSYVLSAKGLYINDQLHPIQEFRSFGIQQEEAMPALVLIPVKRFRPGMTVYFPQELGESIVNLLGAHIPMQELKPDAFDRITRKLRM